MHPQSETFTRYIRWPLPLAALPATLPFTSAPPLDAIALPGGQDLGACTLAAHGQTHGVTPAAVAAHVAQAGNILDDAPPQVVLNRQGRQAGCQGRQGRAGQVAEAGLRVDMVRREEAREHAVAGGRWFVL